MRSPHASGTLWHRVLRGRGQVVDPVWGRNEGLLLMCKCLGSEDGGVRDPDVAHRGRGTLHVGTRLGKTFRLGMYVRDSPGGDGSGSGLLRLLLLDDMLVALADVPCATRDGRVV
jgi:hypothetical protein